jgi:septal ring-binding cell division protein DamX
VPTTPPQKLTAPAAPVAATTATTTATTTPTASGDVSAAIDKIKSMNKNSFFVQHIALDNAEEAQLWRRQYPALSGAMVTAIQVEGGRRIKYVVVSGPFADRAAANEYAKRAEIPQDSWIRTVRSLQDAAPPVAARRP